MSPPLRGDGAPAKEPRQSAAGHHSLEARPDGDTATVVRPDRRQAVAHLHTGRPYALPGCEAACGYVWSGLATSVTSHDDSGTYCPICLLLLVYGVDDDEIRCTCSSRTRVAA